MRHRATGHRATDRRKEIQEAGPGALPRAMAEALSWLWDEGPYGGGQDEDGGPRGDGEGSGRPPRPAAAGTERPPSAGRRR